jgi:hypothetical protein
MLCVQLPQVAPLHPDHQHPARAWAYPIAKNIIWAKSKCHECSWNHSLRLEFLFVGKDFLLTLQFSLLRYPAATTSYFGHIKPPSVRRDDRFMITDRKPVSQGFWKYVPRGQQSIIPSPIRVEADPRFGCRTATGTYIRKSMYISPIGSYHPPPCRSGVPRAFRPL